MSYVLTAIAFIVIFSILVLVHEFGHFIMAKRAGIKVEEFGFGLPPRLWGKKKGETIYSINWIPFGGFVRMFGEDQGDPKLLRSKRSFAAQSMRSRVLVIVAGVVMNFLLAWLLMCIGFSVGMQPMIIDAEDAVNALNSGQMLVEQGVKVKTVEPGSLAAQAGFKADDVIYAINTEKVDSENIIASISDPAKVYGVLRNNQLVNISIGQDILPKSGEIKFGLNFYDFGSFLRVKIYNLRPNSLAYQAGLRSEDVILSVNGQQINSISEYEKLIRGVRKLEYEVYRDGQIQKITLERNRIRQVLISGVLPGSPAAKTGISKEDIVVSVNGKEIEEREELMSYVKEHQSEVLKYAIDRAGSQLFFDLKPVEGRVGIQLSELINYVDEQGFSLYDTEQLVSVKEIKNVQYPVHVAIYKSLGETWRMSVATAKMFSSFVSGLIRRGEIPETVSGPIGIAQMTHRFVEEGWIPLLRFVAVLSLSLAVINILPFPALDGGRLLFIVIELIIGRRVNSKWENWIHGLGYVLIMLLIIAVTYNDILRFFQK